MLIVDYGGLMKWCVYIAFDDLKILKINCYVH